MNSLKDIKIVSNKEAVKLMTSMLSSISPPKPNNWQYDMNVMYWDIYTNRLQIHSLKKLFKIDGVYYYEGLIFEQFPKYIKSRLYSDYFEVFVDEDNENRVMIKTRIDFKDRPFLTL